MLGGCFSGEYRQNKVYLVYLKVEAVMLKGVYYFIDEDGGNPVKEFIDSWKMREMRKIKLENIDIGLKEELKDKDFKRLYDLERAKVALAQKIAELREEKHLRQSDLARKLGVSQKFISQIETGQEKNLTLETMIKIARSLDRGISISFPKLTGTHTSCLKIT